MVDGSLWSKNNSCNIQATNLPCAKTAVSLSVDMFLKQFCNFLHLFEEFGISVTLLCLICLPDISISTVSHTGPMIAGEWYELQCFIQNVVFKIVDVRWYKLNQINVTETIKTPANLTYKVRIRPDRADDGAQFWCEAKLEAKGPQRYSTMSSDHLSITVHCMYNNLFKFLAGISVVLIIIM